MTIQPVISDSTPHNQIRIVIFLLVMVLFLILAPVRTVYACSCDRSYQPEVLKILEAFRNSDLVFIGKVVNTKLDTAKDNFEVDVNITKSYKGASEGISGKVVTRDPSGTTCGFPFAAGKDYLVYVDEIGDFTNFYWKTDICTRTNELTNAKKDLFFLNRFGDFNNTAFKIYKHLGLITLIPIPHTPEGFGLVEESSSSYAKEGRTHVSPIWSEGIVRVPTWYEGWKVFANLFIWIVVIVVIILILRRKFLSKYKTKTK